MGVGEGVDWYVEGEGEGGREEDGGRREDDKTRTRTVRIHGGWAGGSSARSRQTLSLQFCSVLFCTVLPNASRILYPILPILSYPVLSLLSSVLPHPVHLISLLSHAGLLCQSVCQDIAIPHPSRTARRELGFTLHIRVPLTLSTSQSINQHSVYIPTCICIHIYVGAI